MKKAIVTILLSFGLVTLLPQFTFASPAETNVHGDFTGASRIAGAQVQMNCNGSDLTTTTDAFGNYQVMYALGDCPIGAQVVVSASKYGHSVTSAPQTIVSSGSGGDASVSLFLNDITQVSSGGVVDKNGNSVVGAQVQVSCNGHDLTTTTDTNGDYGEIFDLSTCPIGSTVVVTASKDGSSGTNNGPVLDFTNGSAFVPAIHLAVASVPEMSTTVGTTAGIVGAGALILARRRALGKFTV